MHKYTGVTRPACHVWGCCFVKEVFFRNISKKIAINPSSFYPGEVFTLGKRPTKTFHPITLKDFYLNGKRVSGVFLIDQKHFVAYAFTWNISPEACTEISERVRPQSFQSFIVWNSIIKSFQNNFSRFIKSKKVIQTLSVGGWDLGWRHSLYIVWHHLMFNYQTTSSKESNDIVQSLKWGIDIYMVATNSKTGVYGKTTVELSPKGLM